MSSEKLDRLQALVLAALELPRTERAAFLAAECGSESALRSEVEALLQFDGHLPSVMRDLDGDPGVEPRLPRHIGPYRVLGVLGRGGMGIVYRAEQQRPRRLVALKVLQAGAVRDELRKRFQQEVELLGSLQHPGIAKIYDAGTFDSGYGELPYFAMELIDGMPLHRYAERHDLDPAARCLLVARVADAVQHAHERGIVHRDLKPGNVLVIDAPGDEARPVVLDFGIARSTGSDLALSTLHTHSGQLVGTLPYMSPEQLDGRGEAVDARTDVYALGVIMFELLAGRLPHVVDDKPLTAIVRLLTATDAPPLGTVDARLRGDIETIVGKALAKDRSCRYDSAAALAADLRRCVHHQPIAARPPTTLYQLGKFARRNKPLVGGVVATMVVLFAGAVVATIFAIGENRERRLAEQVRDDLRCTSYRTAMRLAGDLLDVPGGLSRVRHAVTDWLPAAGQGDLRGFEWHLLDALSRGGEQQFAVPTQRPCYRVFWTQNDRLLLQAGDLRFRTLAGTEHAVPATGTLRDLSADRRRAICTNGGPIEVRDVETGRILHRRDFGKADPARWIGDRRVGVIVRPQTRDGKLVIWDLDTESVLATVGGPPDHPLLANFAATPDGTHVAVARANDSVVDVWDVTEGRFACEFHGQQGDVLTLAWRPDGSLLATGGADDTIHLWRPAHGEPEAVLHGHAQNVLCLEFDSTGEYLASGSEDFTLRVWSVATGKSRLIGTLDSAVRDLAWSPDGRRLATLGRDQRVTVFDVTAVSAARVLVPAHGDEMLCTPLYWSRESRLAAYTRQAGTRVWDPNDPADEGMPTTGLAAWSHDGELQALARGNRVDVRRVEGGDLLASREFDGPVRADWSPQNRELLVRTPEHMWLWRPDPDASPHELAKRFHWSAWSPDGREIAYADWGDRVWFLDVASGAKVELPLPSGGRPFCGAWSPDGTRMVIGRLDPVLQIVDRAARTVTKTLRAHIARVIAVAWSPDGNRIASGSWDRTVRVWDAASGLELLALRHAANVGAVAWDARGERLATLTEDGCLRVWSTDAAQRR